MSDSEGQRLHTTCVQRDDGSVLGEIVPRDAEGTEVGVATDPRTLEPGRGALPRTGDAPVEPDPWQMIPW